MGHYRFDNKSKIWRAPIDRRMHLKDLLSSRSTKRMFGGENCPLTYPVTTVDSGDLKLT
jgi:hypothetical protein